MGAAVTLVPAAALGDACPRITSTIPTAQPAIFLGRPFGRAAGSAQQNIDVDGYRAVGGVRGDLDKAGMPDWSYDLSLTWHVNKFQRRNPDILFDRFQEAVNSCSDPNDLTRCFNPWYTRDRRHGHAELRRGAPTTSTGRSRRRTPRR